MRTKSFPWKIVATAQFGALALLLAGAAQAHCDSMDGPVVADAQKALNAGDIQPVLKWVFAPDEAEIRSAFKMTQAVRGESETARQLADRYFFETLVRVHRAGEGEGFTGLKPAGSTAPGIAAADKALVSGNATELADKVSAAVREGVLERFASAHELRKTAEDSAEQGRKYVQAYVQFTHFVEAADQMVEHGASHGHTQVENAVDHGH